MKNSKKQSFISLITFITSALYLYIAFSHNLWYPACIIYLVIPLSIRLWDLFEKKSPVSLED